MQKVFRVNCKSTRHLCSMPHKGAKRAHVVCDFERGNGASTKSDVEKNSRKAGQALSLFWQFFGSRYINPSGSPSSWLVSVWAEFVKYSSRASAKTENIVFLDSSSSRKSMLGAWYVTSHLPVFFDWTLGNLLEVFSLVSKRATVLILKLCSAFRL